MPQNYTSRKIKATRTGNHGKDYEELFPVLQVLLLHHHNIKNFEIYTNAGSDKFDDLILKLERENEKEEELMVQIKHGVETITHQTSPVTLSNEAFENLFVPFKLDKNKKETDIPNGNSLMAYFRCYLKENLRGKNLVYFTNKNFNLRVNYKNQNNCKKCDAYNFSDNLNCSVFFTKIKDNDEKFVTKKYGERFKVCLEYRHQKFIKEFSELFREVYKFYPNENEVKNFFSDLVFATEQPSHKKIEEEIKKLLSFKLAKREEVEMAINKIKNLFKIKNEEIETVNIEKLLQVFDEIEIYSKFCRFEGISNENLIEIGENIFKENVIKKLKEEIGTKKLSVVIAPEGLNKLACSAICQMYDKSLLKNGKIIYLRKSTLEKQSKSILEISDELEVLLVDFGNDEINHQLLPDLLLKRCKVFCVTSKCNSNAIKLSKNNKLIEDFDQTYVEEIYNTKVSFQNQILRVCEIIKDFREFKNLIQHINDDVLAQMVNGSFRLGSEIKNQSFKKELYVNRILINEEANEEIGSEDKVEQFMKKPKSFLIYGISGMGKSTEVIDFGLKIKESYKNIWVLLIEFGSNEFLKAFNEWTKRNRLLDFLKMFMKSSLEKLFLKILFREGKVVVIFDAFDEIPSEIFDDVFKELIKRVVNSKSNKFLITSKFNIMEKMSNEIEKDFKNDFEKNFSILSFKPLEDKEQENYLVNYWTVEIGKSKNIKHLDNLNKKMPDFAKKLIEKWSICLKNYDDFLGIPLQIQMLAEIFELKIKTFWTSEGKLPDIPEIFNITHLFKEFINKKFLVFCEKGFHARTQIVKIFTGNVEVASIFLKIAVNVLRKDENPKNYEFYLSPKEIQNIGLVKYSNGLPSFIHNAYSEFLIAEEFMQIVLKKNVTTLTEFDENVLNIVLKSQKPRELTLLFINELLQTDTNLLEDNSKFELLKEFHDTVTTLSKPTNPNIMKRFSDVLKIVIYIHDNLVQPNTDDVLKVVKSIVFRVVSEGHNDQEEAISNLLSSWNLLTKSDKNKLSLLKFQNNEDLSLMDKVTAFYNYVFKMSFKPPRNQNVIKVYHSTVNFSVQDNLNKEHNLNVALNKCFANSLNIRPLLKFFDKNLNSISLENVSEPKLDKVLDYLKESVSDFDDMNFPFIHWQDTLEICINKIEKMRELFIKTRQTNFENLYVEWLKKAKQFCAQWNKCELNREGKFDYWRMQKYLLFIGKSLVGSLKINLIHMEQIDYDVCEFLLQCKKKNYFEINDSSLVNCLSEHKLTQIQPQNEEVSNKTTCFFCLRQESHLQTLDKYEASRDVSSFLEYQNIFFALHLILSHEYFDNYKVYTNAEDAGRFDDFVCEYIDKGVPKINFVCIKSSNKIFDANSKRDYSCERLFRGDTRLENLITYLYKTLKCIQSQEYESFEEKKYILYTNLVLPLHQNKYFTIGKRNNWDKIYIHFDTTSVTKQGLIPLSYDGDCFKLNTTSINDEYFNYVKENMEKSKHKQMGRNETEKYSLDDIKCLFENFIICVNQQNKLNDKLDTIITEIFDFEEKYKIDTLKFRIEQLRLTSKFKQEKINKSKFDALLESLHNEFCSWDKL